MNISSLKKNGQGPVDQNQPSHGHHTGGCKFNLKTAVEAPKNRAFFEPSAGSARKVFEALTQLVRSPFALSSLRSGRVEGLYANQLPPILHDPFYCDIARV